MKKFIIVALFFCLSAFSASLEAQDTPVVKAKITVSPEVKDSLVHGGRLILYLTRNRGREPLHNHEVMVGVTPQNWDVSKPFFLNTNDKQVIFSGFQYSDIRASDKFYAQAVYKQNIDDGVAYAPGNLYSNIDSTTLDSGTGFSLQLDKIIPRYKIVRNKFVKRIVIKSKYLSKFWGRPRYLYASVLLPSGYFDHPGKSYPICYRVPGINGRYTTVNNMVANKDFMDWWFSGKAPQIIYVFLDSRGPYGDTYQVDSENNGPCGKALTQELIPEIERQVHYRPESHHRYLTGMSTGGWVVLGLQIFYPDFFDGAWSYSPDPVDFEHLVLSNIYKDESFFYNRYGYLQPETRTIYGEPKSMMKEAVQEENVLSRTGDYRVSGEQYGAYNAVFGPKGKDGLPSLMFDPVTGKINHEVAKQWEKYDLKKVLEKNWTTLGPKLQGKIWIWTGDMDNLYSNVATRFLKKFLDKTQNPKSDAKINFSPMNGHCQEWSDKAVLKMVEAKVTGK